VCSKCNETKAPSEFYVSKYLSTGLHSQCKKCVRAGQERRVRCPPEKAAPEKVCRCGNPSLTHPNPNPDSNPIRRRRLPRRRSAGAGSCPGNSNDPDPDPKP